MAPGRTSLLSLGFSESVLSLGFLGSSGMGTFGQGKQDSKVPGACSRAASRLLLLNAQRSSGNRLSGKFAEAQTHVEISFQNEGSVRSRPCHAMNRLSGKFAETQTHVEISLQNEGFVRSRPCHAIKQ